MSQTDYPQGDGSPNCPLCKGRGVVNVPKNELPPWLPMGAARPCECVRERDLRDHLDTIWKVLSSVIPAESSPLAGQEKNNLWITSNLETLKLHLARVARDRGLRWKAKVITDIDLMTTWLYSANEVLDPDVEVARERGENKASRLTDLTEPPDLLIIRLGAKAARNVAAPEVLLEVLQHRQHLGKPTWIVDSPGYPLGNGHIDYDFRVEEFLSDWQKLNLAQSETTTVWRGKGYQEWESEVMDQPGRVPFPMPRPAPRQERVTTPTYDTEETGPTPAVGLKLFADKNKPGKKGGRR